MDWIQLTDTNTLEEINKESFSGPVLIFKHSTRCATSALVKNKLERNWNSEEAGHIKPFFLDLIRYREVSNAIESKYGILHESPQAIIIENGKASFDASHFHISYHNLLAKRATG